MWGGKDFSIMTNAIDTSKYKFNESSRNSIRKRLMINDKFVIICVGRLSDQKNQVRLVDIFSCFTKRHSDSVLLFVGEGDKEEEIRCKSKKYGIEDNVFMLGVRDDIEELLSAADCFVLPSNFEGLPISVIEAQCSGLPCLLSDSITKEVKLTNLVTYLSLQMTDDKWCDKIDICYRKRMRLDRTDYWKIIEEKGYGILKSARNMQDFYLGLEKNNAN